ncbi:hypothetical protein D3C78_1539930 [compost metagenome]
MGADVPGHFAAEARIAAGQLAFRPELLQLHGRQMCALVRQQLLADPGATPQFARRDAEPIGVQQDGADECAGTEQRLRHGGGPFGKKGSLNQLRLPFIKCI